MEKKIKYIMLSIVLLVGLMGVAYSYGGYGRGSFGRSFSYDEATENLHNEFRTIIESGTYNEFENFKKNNNWDIMPWIENSEDFYNMQNSHKARIEYNEKNGYSYNQGRGYGRGGCPYSY